jgi:hypothetical protein
MGENCMMSEPDPHHVWHGLGGHCGVPAAMAPFRQAMHDAIGGVSRAPVRWIASAAGAA